MTKKENRVSVHSFLRNKVVLLILIVSVFAVTSGVTIAKAVEVKKPNIVHNDIIIKSMANGDTVTALLSDRSTVTKKIAIQTGAELKPSIKKLVKFLKDGTSIVIVKAIPISILADQKRSTVYLNLGTVKNALDKAGIRVFDKDIVTPELDMKIMPGMNIRIVRTELKTIVEKTSIPFQLVLKKDRHMLVGKTKITQHGALGERRKSILVTMRDGVEISRKVISEMDTKAPVNKVVVRGTRAPVVSRGASTRRTSSTNGKVSGFEYKKVRVMTATAYTYTGNKTATGATTKRGIIAVDPRVIPLGTRLYIEGYGYGVAQDTGGLINGNIVDLFMTTNSEAFRWGRRSVKVYILK